MFPIDLRSISGVSVVDLLSFMQNLMQACCFILPSIADKTNTSRKSTHVKTMYVTAWCHVADWCSRLSEVWPWPPLWSFTEVVTTNTVRELSDTTSYKYFAAQVFSFYRRHNHFFAVCYSGYLMCNPLYPSYPCDKPWRSIWLWDVESSTSTQSAHRWQ
jgi:hypothetical protein